MALGQAVFEILANLDPLRLGLMSAGRLAMSAVGSISRAMVNLIGGAIQRLLFQIKLATAAFAAFSVMSVRAFSELQRTSRLFSVAFGEMADEMNQWVSELAVRTGAGSGTLKNLAGSLHLIVEEIADGRERTEDLTRRLTEMILQMRSLFGGNLEEYLNAVRSGLFGMARALRRYGIILSDEEVRQRALNDERIRGLLLLRAQQDAAAEYVKGFGWMRQSTKDLTKYLTDNELAYARLILMLEKFQNLSTRLTWKNRTVSDSFFVLREQITNTMESVGQGLAPSVQRIADALSEFLMTHQEGFVRLGETVGRVLESMVSLAERLTSAFQKGGLRELSKSIGQELAAAFQSVKPYAVDIGRWIAQGFLETVFKRTPSRESSALPRNLLPYYPGQILYPLVPIQY